MADRSSRPAIQAASTARDDTRPQPVEEEDLRAPNGAGGHVPGSRVRPIVEAPSALRVAIREAASRRALGVADAVAAAASLTVPLLLVRGEGLRLGVVVAELLLILLAKLYGLYDRDDLVLKKSTLDELPAIVQMTAIYALLVWLGQDLVFSHALTREQVLAMWAVGLVAAVGCRLAARFVVGHLASEERCLVIGDDLSARHISGKLADPHVRASVVARLPSVLDGHRCDDTELVLRRTVHEHRVDRVLIALADADSAAVVELIRVVKALGVRVTLVPRILEVVGSSVEFDSVAGLAMLGVRRFGLTRSSRLLKRSFDLAGSVLGILVISPIMGVLAILIKLDSPGPVFFRQTRVGRNGATFDIVKFRTMVADAEARKHELLEHSEHVGLFKIADDPRITRVGRLLRQTSIDELPQLFNVACGQMSLVGPRPLVIDESVFVTSVDGSRFELTPGMTGPWQILGHGRVGAHEMVGLDYLYIANWNLWADIKILLRTVAHVTRRRGM